MKKYIQLFENWNREETILLTRKNRPNIRIEIKVVHGTIEEIDNNSGEEFPFFTGQPLTVWTKGWACNNGFLWNDKDPCDRGDERVFSIKTKDVPKGDPLRFIYPSKFRK
jgi:hypothetical protein